MSRESSPDQDADRRLDDDTVIYRAASARKYLTDDKQHAAPQAFHRRPLNHPHPDYDGLSFGLTPDDAVKGLSKWHGVIRLKVGDLRALRLKEGDDKELIVVTDDIPGHAVITNLPYHDEDDLPQLAEADTWAEKLADIAEVRPEDQLSNR